MTTRDRKHGGPAHYVPAVGWRPRYERRWLRGGLRARIARVNVETILRAVRAGELPAAGYVGRSPRISRDALVGWLATRSPSAPQPPEVEVGRQTTLSRRHGNGWVKPGHGPSRRHRGHLQPRDGRARRAEACHLGRDHAGAQRPASRASGLDRIVGVMSASGPHDALLSNCGRGATMGPSGCGAQSSPVVSVRAQLPVFAGIKCELGGLEGTRGFPDEE